MLQCSNSPAEKYANTYNIPFKDFNSLSTEQQIELFGDIVTPSYGSSSAPIPSGSSYLTVIPSGASLEEHYTAHYDEKTKKFIFDYTPKENDQIIFTAVSKLTGETITTYNHTFTKSEIVKGANGLAVSISGDINDKLDLDVETVVIDNGNSTETDTDKTTDSDSKNNTHTDNIKYGDLDNDGKLTSSDALKVLRASVGLEKFDDTQKKLADVDNDGKLTSSDSLVILRYSVGYRDKGTLLK